MPDLRPKRFRVTGYDANGDIQAFETDNRERARTVEKQMKEIYRDVSCDMQRKV